MHSTTNKVTASTSEVVASETRTKRRNREIVERTAALPKIAKEVLDQWIDDGHFAHVSWAWGIVNHKLPIERST